MNNFFLYKFHINNISRIIYCSIKINYVFLVGTLLFLFSFVFLFVVWGILFFVFCFCFFFFCFFCFWGVFWGGLSCFSFPFIYKKKIL